MEYQLIVLNGERPDPITGHYHLGNGYRAYHSRLARFSSPDSWSPYDAGGINPYTYCVGDPINRSDPSGHMSVGQWIGMAVGLVAGITLSIVTDGAAIPAVASLMATAAGDAMIGAGAEMVAEAVDGKRINWGQVGIAAGISVAAVLGGYGLGRAANRLRGVAGRPFSSLMMSGGRIIRGLADEDNPLLSGQFRRPVFFGIVKPSEDQRSSIALSFTDRLEYGERLNIIAPAASDDSGQNIAMGIGNWKGANYEPAGMDATQVAGVIEAHLFANPNIRSVRLAIPDAARQFGSAESFQSLVTRQLQRREINLNVTAPQGGIQARGPIPIMLNTMLAELDEGLMNVIGANRHHPAFFQAGLSWMSGRYSEYPGAFNIEFL